MPTFVDESGCTGTSAGSKPYFRLCAVWVPVEKANPFRDCIKQLRRTLGLREDYEFHFFELGGHPERKEAFFKCAMDHKFRFAMCSIEKRRPPWSKLKHVDFHGIASITLAATLRPLFCEAEAAADHWASPLIVDDNKDKKFLKLLSGAFTDMVSERSGRQLTGKASFQASQHDELLQLADMVCGAAGEQIDNAHSGSSHFFKLIRTAGVGLDCGLGQGITAYGLE